MWHILGGSCVGLVHIHQHLWRKHTNQHYPTCICCNLYTITLKAVDVRDHLKVCYWIQTDIIIRSS